MRLVVCNGVDDRAAEHVKRILFSVVDLQDAKCFGNVIGDQLLIGRGFRFLNAVRDHRDRIHFGHAGYVLALVGRVYSMTLPAPRSRLPGVAADERRSRSFSAPSSCRRRSGLTPCLRSDLGLSETPDDEMLKVGRNLPSAGKALPAVCDDQARRGASALCD